MHYFLYFFALFFLMLMNSCIISQDFNAENTAEEASTRISYPEQGGWLQLTIQNNAPNTVILIDSLILCNALAATGGPQASPAADSAVLTDITLLKCSGHTILPYGHRTDIPKTKMAEQKLSHWVPNALPNETHETFLTIYGKILGVTCNATDTTESYTICSTPMYTALPDTILNNRTTFRTISFHPDSPIYTVQNGTMIKVLEEISFSPYVRPW